MELREFVRSTLLEIVAGVTDAQKALAEEGSTAIINAGATSNLKHHRQGGLRALEMVEFDVALTVTETTDKGIGGRLSIAAASIGTQRGASIENSEVSRVRFSVPIALPRRASLERLLPLRAGTPIPCRITAQVERRSSLTH